MIGHRIPIVPRVRNLFRFIVKTSVGSNSKKIIGEHSLNGCGPALEASFRPLALTFFDVTFGLGLTRILTKLGERISQRREERQP
jgi:hypothetical protein